jgi:SAM-dependent methyltransferase
VLKGTIEDKWSGKDVILAVDAYRRFLFAFPVVTPFDIAVVARKFKMTTEPPLLLYVYSFDDNEAVPLEIPVALQQKLTGIISTAIPDFVPVQIPGNLDKVVEQIIETMNSQSYVSISSLDNIKTGNNYQSIVFDKVLKGGGRPARDLLVRSLNLKGKTVVDLGANTGEMSRIARRLGADLVDGFEYDKFFVETGRLVNGVTGTTRVSLFQADITDRRFYADKKYDIVFAFSVFVYIRHALADLARVTKVLILETHTLDHGLPMYIDAVTQHFPAYRMVGMTDMHKNPHKSRALIAFAANEQALESVVKFTKIVPENYFPNEFFNKYGRPAPGGLLGYLDDLHHKYANVVDPDTATFNGLNANYFLSYLLGYREYVKADRQVTNGNGFLRSYVNSISKGVLDQGLLYLVEDQDSAIAKVRMKFEDLDAASAGNWHAISPPQLALDPAGKRIFKTTSGETLTCINIDGHHRYFVSQLFARPYIECVVTDPSLYSTKFVKGTYHL